MALHTSALTGMPNAWTVGLQNAIASDFSVVMVVNGIVSHCSGGCAQTYSDQVVHQEAGNVKQVFGNHPLRMCFA